MSAHAPTPAIRHRFHLLDALRGVAALCVILVHAPVYVQQRLPPSNAFLAVDFFFCLSGFVLAHAYWQRLETDLGLWPFLRARCIRLYPTYLLAASLGFLWALTLDHRTYAHGLLRLSISNFLLLPNLSTHLSPAAFPFNLPAWSLFFELLISLPFALLARARVSEGLKTRALLCSVLVSFAALSYWCARHRPLGDLGWSSDPRAVGYTFARVCLAFSLGLLLHKLYRRQSHVHVHPGFRSPLFSAALILALGLLLRAPWALLQSPGFQLFYLIGLLPAIVFLGANCRLPHWCDNTCALLGDVSYPLYLLHVPFLRLLGTRHVTLYALAHPQQISILFVLSEVIIVLLSFLALRFYDIPARRFLQQLAR